MTFSFDSDIIRFMFCSRCFMKKSFTVIIASILFLFICLFSSCKDSIMGYSVVLWNIPEYGISDGDVVPVYIRSNISHVYVAGTSDGEKIEIPLWQLTEPVSKNKIQVEVDRYSEYKHNYASILRDGLPGREDPVNTAKQVYRFRKGEIIKILYKGKGQVVMAGSEPLPGEWFRVLTSNGTKGWCFSYNLQLFQTDEKGNKIGGENIENLDETDSVFEELILKTWYPDYFRTLIKGGNIDLSRLIPSYKFELNAETNKLSLNMNKIHTNWDYKGYKKTGDNEYTLNEIPLIVFYRKSDYIVLRYTDESGKPQDLGFVTIEDDISSLVSAEKERRSAVYNKVVSTGPEFKSSSYGDLKFEQDGRFSWKGYKLLVPAIIKNGAKNSGNVSVKYALSQNLSSQYDGVLSFKFDGLDEDINFLFVLEDDGIRMENIQKSSIDGNLVTSRSSSPMILYFKK